MSESGCVEQTRLADVAFSDNHENEVMKMVVLHFVAFKGRAVDVCQLPGSAVSPDLYDQFVNEPVWLQQLCETPRSVTVSVLPLMMHFCCH